MSGLLDVAAAMYGAGWELRRSAYARGWRRPHRVAARVVSVGNLTVGGTGKTTLTLHLGRQLAERATNFAVVCRRYRPGPAGFGDEELMYRDAFGAPRVYAGSNKRDLAARAAADGHAVVLVDDGFSHWQLERDVNLVLLDASDLWGGGKLLPAGRMREPHRALQRADAVVVSRVSSPSEAETLLGSVQPYALAAVAAAGRHRVTGVRWLGGAAEAAPVTVWIVTATGNPAAVERSAREAGLEIAGVSRYRDHHWFSPDEVRRERARAIAKSARVLLTPKDAVRWPRGDADDLVLEVAWEWVIGGEAIEATIGIGA